MIEWRGEIYLPSLKTPVVFKVLDLATRTMSRPGLSAKFTNLPTIEARIKVYEAIIDDWQRVHVFLCRHGRGEDGWGTLCTDGEEASGSGRERTRRSGGDRNPGPAAAFTLRLGISRTKVEQNII